MPKGTIICYLSSLLFYGMGYSKMLVLKTGYLDRYNFMIHVSQATAYFALTIFLAVIGSVFFYLEYTKNQKIEVNDLEFEQIVD